MVAKSKKQIEVENNAKIFFEKLKNGELDDYIGKVALMRKGEIIEFYSTPDDARKTGFKFYEDSLFSIQKVEKSEVDLGYFSHAVF